MSEQHDWLAQTIEIKSKLAKEYGHLPASEQVAAMRRKVQAEWETRGWRLTDKMQRVALSKP